MPPARFLLVNLDDSAGGGARAARCGAGGAPARGAQMGELSHSVHELAGLKEREALKDNFARHFATQLVGGKTQELDRLVPRQVALAKVFEDQLGKRAKFQGYIDVGGRQAQQSPERTGGPSGRREALQSSKKIRFIRRIEIRLAQGFEQAFFEGRGVKFHGEIQNDRR